MARSASSPPVRTAAEHAIERGHGLGQLVGGAGPRAAATATLSLAQREEHVVQLLHRLQDPAIHSPERGDGAGEGEGRQEDERPGARRAEALGARVGLDDVGAVDLAEALELGDEGAPRLGVAGETGGRELVDGFEDRSLTIHGDVGRSPIVGHAESLVRSAAELDVVDLGQHRQHLLDRDQRVDVLIDDALDGGPHATEQTDGGERAREVQGDERGDGEPEVTRQLHASHLLQHLRDGVAR